MTDRLGWHLTPKDLGLATRDANQLASLGFVAASELLWMLPFRYEDRRQVWAVSRLRVGQRSYVRGTITGVNATHTRNFQRMMQVTVADTTGEIHLTLFNPGLMRQVRRGAKVLVWGVVEQRGRRLQLSNPGLEIIGAVGPPQALEPVYRGQAGLTSARIRTLMQRLARAALGRIEDPVPIELRTRHRLPTLGEAWLTLHDPSPESTLEQIASAQDTLRYTEALLLGCAVRQRRQQAELQTVTPLNLSAELRARIEAALPVTPTLDQREAIEACWNDLSRPRSMRRLLQGDVGSGKTLVASYAMCAVGLAGGQAVKLAPTEVLARQHYKTISAQAKRLGLVTRFLAGGVPTSDRLLMLTALRAGRIQLLVGTHAVLEQDVKFRDLRLAVIDEQHKFGVKQREALVQKGIGTHLLLTTATPIPRTLTLALHGDLDVSWLRTRPPGRGPTETRLMDGRDLEQVWRWVAGMLERGHQAYVVCPAVEEGEGEVGTVEQMTRELARRPDLAQAGVISLHGRLHTRQKRAALARFSSGEVRLMVCSTVVEVGVDVPDASVMVVLNADHFGLVQLHQLRGRIGRGPAGGVCVLVADTNRADALQRLATLATQDNGFAIAESDLRQRGPGEFFADRQSGAPRLRALDLSAHQAWIERAWVDLEEHNLTADPLMREAAAAHFAEVQMVDAVSG